MSEAQDIEVDSGYPRLESQIKWYDKQSGRNKRLFKQLKTATLAISVSIPLFRDSWRITHLPEM